MNILITGGTGFMGTYLVPLLLKQGHHIRLLVRDVEKAHKLFGNQCEIIYGDVEKKETMKGCCDGINVVYHMAALMGHDSPSLEAFERFRAVNVEGVRNIVQIAEKEKIEKFIYISSTAAMGLQKDVLIDENTLCKPYTPYQVTKREAELFIIKEIKENQFPAVIVRPSMVYGPGFKGDFLTIAKVCKTGFFPKIGKGKNLSPALYIEDLAEVLIKFLDKGVVGEIYLLSSDQSYTLEETVRIIAAALNKKVHYIYVPKRIALFGAGILEKACNLIGRKQIVTKRNIESVFQDRVIDISKINRDVGYSPQIGLEEGLTKTIEYFVKKGYL